VGGLSTLDKRVVYVSRGSVQRRTNRLGSSNLQRLHQQTSVAPESSDSQLLPQKRSKTPPSAIIMKSDESLDGRDRKIRAYLINSLILKYILVALRAPATF